MAVLFGLFSPTWAQYQSLFWEVSGGALKKPSYLYGTMHISSRVAFQLGDPFYDAMQSTDVVALELEPEQWLSALFDDPEVIALLGSSSGDSFDADYVSESPLPNLRGIWQVGNGLQLSDRVRQALLYEPDILNYLMYRFGDDNLSVDFEEDTWLDMHIYQTAKKMGLQTLGLETYAQSDAFIRKAGMEDAMENDMREWDEGDIQEYEELTGQLEPAYRRQDLDLIDSLSRVTASKAFYTYILLERNKLFVHSIDSMLQSGKSVFAAMGCAHLPGKGGVIELLRAMGYVVSPISKGSRNAKRRQELEKRIFDHAHNRFVSPDGIISFRTPVPVHHANSDKEADTWLAIDMANGANYTVTRLKSYASVTSQTNQSILVMLDSMMYETIAGEVISKKRIRLAGYEGIDIVNKTRRGDFRRQQVWVLPDEILILKLVANGDKVKQGYGDTFFNDLQFQFSATTDNNWISDDGAVSLTLPSRGVSYSNPSNTWQSADFEVIATESENGSYYLLQRHVVEDPGFLDEDTYELNRLLFAFAEDWSADIIEYVSEVHKGMPAIQAHLRTSQTDIFALLVIHNLSYLVLSSNDLDAARRDKRFNSFDVNNPPCPAFYDYQNSELYFETKLPYIPLQLEPSLEALMFNADLEEKQKTAFGTSASIALNPPGDAQSIKIDFQRYHEFSDGEDTASFFRDKRELVMGLDMQVLSEKAQWSALGAVFEFVVGDTGSCRRYMHKMLLHNKSFYHLSASFDSTTGPSEFITMAFSNFECIDTIFPYPHFQLRDFAYLDALASTDTILRSRAIAITGEMDFSPASAARIREVVTQLDSFQPDDAALIRAKLISGLAADTSTRNIDFVVAQFNAFPDSAEYQYELLSLLLQMKTARAWRTYTQLIVEEPPIVFDEMGGSGCEALFDSVKLAAPLIPQLMQLLAIDEYEESIYHLMAMAADSGWLPLSTYRYMVPQILVEARNEWKRLRNINEGGYVFNTDPLLDYCTLLNPVRKEKDIALFFEKAYSSRNGNVLIDLMQFDWDHGRAPSDSLIRRLVRMNDHVHSLYEVLWQYDAAIRMPDIFNTRYALTELYLKNGYEVDGERIDSVVLIDRHSEQIRGTKLDVFFLKVHKPSSGQWLGHVLAFDASNDKNAWPLFIESERSVVLDSDEDPLKELQAEYRFMEENNREFVNFGTGAGDFSVHWY